jgi:Fur family transcriptional regulator, ferric uptake regulator
LFLVDILPLLHIIIIDIFCNKEKIMSCLAIHSRTLRERGYRMTPQRLAILQALHHGGHLSPAQIYERVHKTGMTEATVYRTLEFLAGNHVVHPTQVGGGHLAYELAGHDHHHLVCRVCGAQMDLEPDSFKEAISRIALQTGYQVDAGHLTFFGLCPECQAAS